MSETDGHFCPVCRCMFPTVGPQIESSTIDGRLWVGMAANAQRIIEEYAALRGAYVKVVRRLELAEKRLR